ncbi:MAG TPA: hypothetical protein VGG33_26390, partial [Polyangia bacterium]
NPRAATGSRRTNARAPAGAPTDALAGTTAAGPADAAPGTGADSAPAARTATALIAPERPSSFAAVVSRWPGTIDGARPRRCVG